MPYVSITNLFLKEEGYSLFIEKAKQTLFPDYNYKTWERLIKQSIPVKHTKEGMLIKPLYVKSDWQHRVNSELYSNARDFNNNWKISQKMKHRDWNTLVDMVRLAICNGQDAIAIDCDYLSDHKQIDFNDLKKIMTVNEIPFVLRTSNYPLIIKKLLEVPFKHVIGIIATDPISAQLNKKVISKLSVEWLENVQKLADTFGELKVILVDMIPYSNGGANTLAVLALAIAEAVYYIECMKKLGWSPEKTVNKIAFHFQIGDEFYVEIAKIRAFRVLWRTILNAYQIHQAAVTISAETATFQQSSGPLNEHDIILRAGTAALAASIGGIDYLHVTPFHEEDKLATRIARNTQLIMREEAYFHRVSDPCGGSFYVEALTEKLIDGAWKIFQKIDQNGGILHSLRESDFQNTIGKWQNKEGDIDE